MRIEINATGIGSVSSLQTGLSKLHTDICATIESLQDTKRKIDNITGGVDNLSDASASLQNRIRTEENKLSAVERLKQKTNTFIDNTVSTDSEVAHLITVNQEKFFETWSRSPMAGEKSWWERFVDGWNDFWDDVGEVLDNVLTGIVEFIKEHAVEIIIGVVLVILGAALVAITGGGGAVAVGHAFLAALKAAGVSAGISALTSAAISSVLGLMTGDNILEAFGEGLLSGFIWGGIFAGGSFIIAGILKISSRCGLPEILIGKIKIWSPNQTTNNNIGGTLIKFTKTFHIDVDVNIVKYKNSQLFHTHIPYSVYNALPDVARKMTWIFAPAKRDVHLRLIPILAPIVSNLTRED